MKPRRAPLLSPLFLCLLAALVSPQRPAGQNVTAMEPKFLKNLDDLVLQIAFIKAQKFNTTLNETDQFALNNRIYAFQWQNGIFSRLPFPTNVTFYDCDGIKPEIARVVTPLKNRFAVRPVNATQMNCPLHLRFIENTHYMGKFTRTVMEFTSPCLETPLYKYILNKSGLRQILRLRILGVRLTFEFWDVVQTRRRQIGLQAYNRFRLVKADHHPMFVPNKRYKRENETQSFVYKGNKMTPTQVMALQAESLQLLRYQYEAHNETFESLDQPNEYKSRNETIPRKTKQDGRGPTHGLLRHPNFRPSKDRLRRNVQVMRRLVGKGNLGNLRQMLHEGLSKSYAKMGREQNWFKDGEDERLGLDVNGNVERMVASKIRALKKQPKHHTERKLSQKPASQAIADSINFSPQFLSFIHAKKGRQLSEAPAKKAKKRAAPPKRKLRWGRSGQARDAVNTILANEPYKVDTCQKICTAETYYPSWEFCRRVCGISVQFLTNTQRNSVFASLFPKVEGHKIAGTRVFIEAQKESKQQFSYAEIQALKNSEDVKTCLKTWRAMNCEWSV